PASPGARLNVGKGFLFMHDPGHSEDFGPEGLKAVSYSSGPICPFDDRRDRWQARLRRQSRGRPPATGRARNPDTDAKVVAVTWLQIRLRAPPVGRPPSGSRDL